MLFTYSALSSRYLLLLRDYKKEKYHCRVVKKNFIATRRSPLTHLLSTNKADNPKIQTWEITNWTRTKLVARTTYENEIHPLVVIFEIFLIAYDLIYESVIFH